MEKTYRAIIIDDEESAIDNLCFELKRYGHITIEGIAHNGKSGMKLIEKVHPDLLFQDVELPDMTGMEVVSQMQHKITWEMCTVFYTAYNKYMIDAFRNYAFDFLLKPVDPKELEVVLTRVSERLKEKAEHAGQPALPETEKTFMVITPANDLRFLRPSEIGYFRYLSDRKLWEVALANGTFLPLKRSTTAMQLCSYNEKFVQIHQSYIINMNYLIMVQDNRCIMYPPFDGVEELQVSKKHKKEMMRRFFQL